MAHMHPAGDGHEGGQPEENVSASVEGIFDLRPTLTDAVPVPIGIDASAYDDLSIAVLIPWGLSALSANFVAFCVAYLVSYFGNATLAFPETRLGPASFFRFLAVSLASLGLNQALVFVVVELAGRPYWQALAVVLIAVPPLTFLAMKYWGVHSQRSWR